MGRKRSRKPAKPTVGHIYERMQCAILTHQIGPTHLKSAKRDWRKWVRQTAVEQKTSKEQVVPQLAVFQFRWLTHELGMSYRERREAWEQMKFNLGINLRF